MNAEPLDAVAWALAAGGIGRPFFCAITLRLHTATVENAAAALALAEAALGPVAALEARMRPGGGRALLLQAYHAEGGITQVMLHVAPRPAASLDLDGSDGSLRLDAGGVLVRHTTGHAEELPLSAAGLSPDPNDLGRLATRIRAALVRERTAEGGG